jgi:hypothetical protein
VLLWWRWEERTENHAGHEWKRRWSKWQKMSVIIAEGSKWSSGVKLANSDMYKCLPKNVLCCLVKNEQNLSCQFTENQSQMFVHWGNS